MHLLIDGHDQSPTLILAHGAGAPMDSGFMQQMTRDLVEQGIRVVRFEFPYMQERRESGKKRPPNRQPELIDCFNSVIESLDGPVFVGGKSMGGRMASILAAAENCDLDKVKGLVCLGYPFHPPGKPEKLRVEHLPLIKCPGLILQGTRDPLGKADEVAEYDLGDLQVEWLQTADHDFKPLKKSGNSQDDMIKLAAQKVGAFITELADDSV